MKIFIPGPLPDNPRNLLRRAGYGEKPGYQGQMSYTRRLGGGNYPRFHIYFDAYQNGFQINLHLDQKQPSYGDNHAHSGEYEGKLVAQEGTRIFQFIAGLKRSMTNAKNNPPPAQSRNRGFWHTLLGG